MFSLPTDAGVIMGFRDTGGIATGGAQLYESDCATPVPGINMGGHGDIDGEPLAAGMYCLKVTCPTLGASYVVEFGAYNESGPLCDSAVITCGGAAVAGSLDGAPAIVPEIFDSYSFVAAPGDEITVTVSETGGALFHPRVSVIRPDNGVNFYTLAGPGSETFTLPGPSCTTSIYSVLVWNGEPQVPGPGSLLHEPGSYEVTISGCSIGACGDGTINQACEACDLGPAIPDSGNCPVGAEPPTCGACPRSCSNTCQLIGRCTGSAECCTAAAECPVGEGCCGNGTVESGETCDDGNTLGGDTCTAQCVPDVTYPPIACCPRGSEVAGSTVAANRKLKLTRLDKPAGDQRFISPGETVLLPGQSLHPCTEDVTYCVESSGGIVYSAEVSGGAFGPKPPCRDTDGRVSAVFRGVKPYTASGGLKRIQLKNSSSQPNRFKHQVHGQSVDLSAASMASTLRQTLIVGDTCLTSVLSCDLGPKTKKCVPVP